MTSLVATTTWNCIDLVETFLTHYRQLGFDQVLAMDFDSRDGTADLLRSSAWRPFVTTIPFPGLAGLDSSNTLLEEARNGFQAGRCLFCDPDELLVTPGMRADDLRLEFSPGVGAVTIPRFNVTAEQSVAQSSPERLTPSDALRIRIDQRHERHVGEDVLRDHLDPPWIFTAVPGKVAVDISLTSAIGDGDHVAHELDRVKAANGGTYLLHYPFRSYEAFLAKVSNADLDLRSNTDLPAEYGWHLKRWIRLARMGVLHEEYVNQFIPDGALGSLLLDGSVVVDRSIVTCLGTRALRE